MSLVQFTFANATTTCACVTNNTLVEDPASSSGSPSPTISISEEEWDFIGVGLIMIAPFIFIPSSILLFRGVRKLWKWWRSRFRNAKMDAMIDAELSWIAKTNDKFRLAFELSWLGRYWSMLQAYFTVASLIFYVIGTYTRRIAYARQVLEALQTFVACFFAVDYLILLLVSQDRLWYFFSWYSLIDLLSIVPAFTHFVLPSYLNGRDLIETVLVLPALRILRFDRILYFTKNEVQREIGLLMLPFLSLMFLSTAVINAIQVYYDANGVVSTPADVGSFHDAMYFIVVTMSTVGYGDVSPQHTPVRMIMMCLIVVFLVMLPIYTGRLVEVLSKRKSQYLRSFSHTSPHFIVMGNVNVDGTLVLLRELINNVHDGGKTKILLFSVEPQPSTELRALIDNPYFRHKIVYLQGSPLSVEDLERARVAQAKAVFIVASPAGKPTDVLDDASVTLYSETVKRFTPETPVFVQLHTSEPKQSRLIHCCDRILCIEDLKMALLGRTCLSPGTMTLVTNIFSTLKQPPETAPTRWHEEYAYGSCHSIQPFVMPNSFAGERFTSAALAIFGDHGSILIGVKRGNSHILLNPSVEIGYVIQPGDVGFLLIHDGDSIPPNFYDLDSNIQAGNQGNAGGVSAALGEDSMPFSDDVPLSTFFHHDTSPLKRATANKLANKSAELSFIKPPPANVGNNDLLTSPTSESTTMLTPIVNDQDQLFSDQAIYDDVLSQPLQEGEFEQHVIICGWSPALPSLVRPLRSSRLRRKQPVVIISEVDPNPETWAELEALQHVYLVTGSARKLSALKRAGVASCSTIIILLDHANGSPDAYDSATDIEVVYISKLVAEANKNANIITELTRYFSLLAPEEPHFEERLVRTRNELNKPELPYRVRYTHMLAWKRESGVEFDERKIEQKKGKETIVEYMPDGTRFLREIDRTQSNKEAYEQSASELNDSGMVRSFPSYHFNPFFASGNLYCPSAADALLFTEFHRPYVMEVVDQLLSMTERPGSSHLFLKPVPDNFVNTSYIELTSHLLKHGIVPIALYRPADIYGNSRPYVYTNPKRLTRLTMGDRVYILASSEPASLDSKALVAFMATLLARTNSSQR